MGSIGPMEMIIVMVAALLIFGPKKLPGLARGLGQAIRGFKEETQKSEKESPTRPPVMDDHKSS